MGSGIGISPLFYSPVKVSYQSVYLYDDEEEEEQQQPRRAG